MKKTTNFPPGWDEGRVRRLLQHYESQTEEEMVAEDEAAFEDPTQNGHGDSQRVGSIRQSAALETRRVVGQMSMA